ncbi:hypothetical protein F4558_005377 [Micromonospora profundi]|nr:hypothetical protein [Micromonospora profundi]
MTATSTISVSDLTKSYGTRNALDRCTRPTSSPPTSWCSATARSPHRGSPESLKRWVGERTLTLGLTDEPTTRTFLTTSPASFRAETDEPRTVVAGVAACVLAVNHARRNR